MADRIGTATRLLLAAFIGLTLLAVGTLYVLAEHTHRFFAWTIDPPLTAAFLGAGYAAGLVGAAVALWRQDWAFARITLESILVFVTATTVATVVHFDRFHFDGTGIAVVAAWAWLVVYLVVPVWIAVVLLTTRIPGRWRRPSAVASPVAALLVLAGVALSVVALAMFFFPATAETLWPWPLTPLTARVTAAWVLTIGVAALLAAVERNRAYLVGPAVGAAILAVLYAAALARYAHQVDWARPAAWIFLGLLATLLITGLAGFRAMKR